MDRQVAGILQQLADDGLDDDTIVFFFSDHGAGLPRSKRWLYDSSTRVPLLIRFPPRWKQHAPAEAGKTTDRLVSFVDFAPTMLSLAGVPFPKHLQGVAFLGEKAGPERQYVYGFRDRMDERYDMLRSVRDKRYKYIRNYHPHLPYFHEQHVSYMYEMPTMRVWQRLAKEGKLTGPAATFMGRAKPLEELYDTQSDPHEIHNLVASKSHQEILARLRKTHQQWRSNIIDLGLLPEADLRTRFGDDSPYDAARRQPELFPLQAIADAADGNHQDSSPLSPSTHELPPSWLKQRLGHTDPAVRYWATIWIITIGERGKPLANELSTTMLQDKSACVRVAAADSLCRLGRKTEALPTLHAGIQDANPWVRLQAANILDRLGAPDTTTRNLLLKACDDPNEYVARVARHATGDNVAD